MNVALLGQEYSLQSVLGLKNHQHLLKRRTLHITSVAILEMSMIVKCVPWNVLTLGYEVGKMPLAL